MLTKAELEDIWHNKPHGHIKTINKKLKKSKRYSVSLRPITYKFHDVYVAEVFSSSMNEAYDQAKKKFQEENPEIVVNAWNIMGYNIV